MPEKSKLTPETIDAIFKEVSEILIRKNEDYGNASFDLGLNGNMVHLWDKVRRYRTLVENQAKSEKPNYESIDDTLKDIIGYAVIGLIIRQDEMP